MGRVLILIPMETIYKVVVKEEETIKFEEEEYSDSFVINLVTGILNVIHSKVSFLEWKRIAWCFFFALSKDNEGFCEKSWVFDIVASHHVINDIKGLSHLHNFTSSNGVLVGNSCKVPITFISYIDFPHYDNNILHVPGIITKLVHVHKLCQDNSIFIEIHSYYFFVKDNHTKKILL